jgi:hypothetical protein
MVDTQDHGPGHAVTAGPDLETTLRGVSDEFYLAVQALAQLERRKRAAVPASAEFLPLSREVRVAAEEVLRIATDQERLAEAAHALQDGLGPIEEVRPAESLAAILADWRAVERELAAAPADSAEAAALTTRYAELRSRYAAALARVRSDADATAGH